MITAIAMGGSHYNCQISDRFTFHVQQRSKFIGTSENKEHIFVEKSIVAEMGGDTNAPKLRSHRTHGQQRFCIPEFHDQRSEGTERLQTQMQKLS